MPAKRRSPRAQIPADHTSSSELIQKKLIVCPISNHDPIERDVRATRKVKTDRIDLPVSVTLKKKVIVMTE